jgi:ribosomal protein L40E
MPQRKNNNEYYVCVECHTVKPWYGDVSCRTCGGKILGPLPKVDAERAKLAQGGIDKLAQAMSSKQEK